MSWTEDSRKQLCTLAQKYGRNYTLIARQWDKEGTPTPQRFSEIQMKNQLSYLTRKAKDEGKDLKIPSMRDVRLALEACVEISNIVSSALQANTEAHEHSNKVYNSNQQIAIAGINNVTELTTGICSNVGVNKDSAHKMLTGLNQNLQDHRPPQTPPTPYTSYVSNLATSANVSQSPVAKRQLAMANEPSIRPTPFTVPTPSSLILPSSAVSSSSLISPSPSSAASSSSLIPPSSPISPSPALPRNTPIQTATPLSKEPLHTTQSESQRVLSQLKSIKNEGETDEFCKPDRKIVKEQITDALQDCAFIVLHTSDASFSVQGSHVIGEVRKLIKDTRYAVSKGESVHPTFLEHSELHWGILPMSHLTYHGNTVAVNSKYTTPNDHAFLARLSHPFRNRKGVQLLEVVVALRGHSAIGVMKRSYSGYKYGEELRSLDSVLFASNGRIFGATGTILDADGNITKDKKGKFGGVWKQGEKIGWGMEDGKLFITREINQKQLKCTFPQSMFKGMWFPTLVISGSGSEMTFDYSMMAGSEPLNNFNANTVPPPPSVAAPVALAPNLAAPDSQGESDEIRVWMTTRHLDMHVAKFQEEGVTEWSLFAWLSDERLKALIGA